MLNQLINVFWTIVSFILVGWYWGEYFSERGSLWMLYIILVVSVFAFNIPAKWLSRLNLSTKTRTYELVGIRAMRWLVQDGMLVNRIQQKLGKKHKVISSRQSARSYLGKIAIQERYHYSCFVFFTLSAITAIPAGKLQMALFISFWNIIYNVYPILLQQYNRLRIQRLLNQVERM